MKMMTAALFSRLSLGAAGLMLASCSLPPDEAWRYIKRDGLIPYIAMEIHRDRAPASRYMDQKPCCATPAPQAVATAPVQPAAPAAPVVSAPVVKPLPTPVLVTRSTDPSEPPVVRPIRPKARDAADALASTPAPAPKKTPAPAPAAAKVDAPKPTPKVEAPKPEPKKEVASKPAPAAPVKPAPAPEKPAAKPAAPAATTPAPAVAKPSSNELPYGTPVAGRPGLVNSPYAGKMQLVDVTGLKPGQEVKCPYSGKLFRVPPGATATAKQAQDAPAKK